jgi:23S rRNA (adenine2503-C2)-methyltransferase
VRTAEPTLDSRDSRPSVRELNLAGIEAALAARSTRAPKALALALSAAIYRSGALTREEVIARAGIGKRRIPLVDLALQLEPLLEYERHVQAEADGSARVVLTVRRLSGPARKERIEAVTIPHRDDLTLCLSSQVGCALACTFCATGLLGFRANLTPGEIVEQLAWAERLARRRVTNVVFMGMGEPLLNYDSVIEAAHRLTRKEGAQVSHRKIVISTAGVTPAIRRFTREKQPFQLFFSLSSAIPEKRRELMPIERSYPLPDLRDAICEYLAGRRRNRLATIEYVAIPGVNMGTEDVDAIRRFVDGLPCILDVIPYNAVGNRYRPPTWAEVKAFTTALGSLLVPVKVRYSGGKSVAAGCGQLAADHVAPAPPGGHMTAPPGIFSDLHGSVGATP